MVPLTGGGRSNCLLRGRESREARERPLHPLFSPPQCQGGRASAPVVLRWGRPHPCLPTSDDQVLQGGPGIRKVPLLACLLERGRDSILVGEDPAVLEGSRHYRGCGWGLDRKPRGWALLKPGDPSWAFSSWLTAAPWWPKGDLHPLSTLGGAWVCGCHLPEVREQAGGPAPV